MKKWHKVVLSIVLVLLVLSVIALNSLDRTPLKETTYFNKTIERLDSLKESNLTFEGDTLKAGWAKSNLTPSYTTSLAGYGIPSFTSVSDSIWIRAFVFDNGIQRIGLLVPDLLIFPPTVKKKIDEELANLNLDNIQYAATHTHHSIGNWHPGLVGRMFAGPFNEQVVEWITSRCVEALQAASTNLQRIKIAYAAVDGEGLVINRLVGKNGTIDPWIRFILMRQDSGNSALLTSFSAHATTVQRDSSAVNRDYPGQLVDRLEDTDEIDFAAFTAGAMASQAPAMSENGNSQSIAESAANQISLIINMLVPQYTKDLGYVSLPIDLRAPQLRISEEMVLAPWLFEYAFGDYSASIDVLRIGDTMMFGTPCDFSGELVVTLDSISKAHESNLMVNSFNGDYIGYITKDTHYELNKYETRTMNWFGPYNGEYFSILISQLITVVGRN